MLNIVLFEPEIPPNTGNIIRLCANTGFALHLIEPLGFTMDDKRLRRAGLDYRDTQGIGVHPDWPSFVAAHPPGRILALSTQGRHDYHEVRYQVGDTLVFGPETRGLARTFLDHLPPRHTLRIPMQANNRSLNLSNAVAIVAYEAWRQLGFEGAKLAGRDY